MCCLKFLALIKRYQSGYGTERNGGGMGLRSWITALLLSCLPLYGFALELITGRVVSVADGDTVTVLDASN